ncbi:MAG TPA: LLM class flavin-dependent oxidoreductase [Streptosporangiaceae bacterium]|nr:LLM class flavin-dependent oxidoreductase [Streptosporangiaceae bacterium]
MTRKGHHAFFRWEDSLPEYPRVGVVVSAQLRARDFAAYVRRVEQLGFYEAWVVDDFCFHGGFAQAATALAVTDSLRVGIGVLPAAARNVVFTAMEVATLAEMHPGRLTVGVGHGMPEWMRQAGDWPSSPLTLLDEYVRVLRQLLSGAEVNFDGRYVKVRDAKLVHPPAVVPPVVTGVRGPLSLRCSGEVAQGTVLAEPVAPEYLAFALAHIGAADHEIIAYNLADVDADPQVARDRVRGALAVVGEPDWQQHVAVLEFGAELAELRSRCGSAAEFSAALPDAWVDQLAVVGTPELARARLAALHGAGADQVAVIPVGDDRIAALERLAALI